MRAGDTVLVRCKASVAASGKVVKEGTVRAEFFAPGRDAEYDPAVRERPDHTAVAMWDEKARSWVAQVPTQGWEPGTWLVRTVVNSRTKHGAAQGSSSMFELVLS